MSENVISKFLDKITEKLKEIPKCPKCGSTLVTLDADPRIISELTRSYRCMKCFHKFVYHVALGNLEDLGKG